MDSLIAFSALIPCRFHVLHFFRSQKTPFLDLDILCYFSILVESLLPSSRGASSFDSD